MSKQLINRYYNELHKVYQYGGSKNEMSIREPFKDLLRHYADKKNLMLIPELRVNGKKGTQVQPDGTLKNAMRLEFGYWESKDEHDDLDKEIHEKLNVKGYPDKNILFEDTQTAVLFQEGAEVMRVSMKNENLLDEILNRFLSYEPLQVKEFNRALGQFTQDVPQIVESLRKLIEEEARTKPEYAARRDRFLELAQAEINPEITREDIREMIIQHILTEDIFTNVFGDADFHKSNNIAKELEEVINTFMTREVRKNYLSDIETYYAAIRNEAAKIADHHEKQKFLKTVYENFYKVYNPKGADRLGVVYTPNEIVRFMIESTDYLLEKHFGKSLADKNVEILDPATGTGTFIAELIEHISPHALPYKYTEELHANEVAILPYYIANLNIEYTYQQRMGSYKEFRNICFVDTLDNTGGIAYLGKQELLFGLSSENAERIKRQNERKISVIIGNPPYNAKQENYNYQNSNRAYKEIDKRIKDTYIYEGTAQNQIVVYDMFVRFFRWATDRIDENGIIAFVSNSSFIDSQAFDGFRRVVGAEFNEAWIINLKGNARTSGERRRQEAGNVFDDQIRVGVAVYFFIKNAEKQGFKVYYNEIGDYIKAEEKKSYLRDNKIQDIAFERITPDAKHNWINLSDNDWDTLLPLIDKEVKAGKSEEAVFKLFSYGFDTKRDDYIFDFDKDKLKKKIQYFISEYNKTVKDENYPNKFKIKWSRNLEREAKRKIIIEFSDDNLINSDYRPYNRQYIYWDKHLISETFLWQRIFKSNEKNIYLAISGLAHSKPFQTLVTTKPHCGDYLEKTQSLPFYVFDSNNERRENITDWALTKFREHYAEDSISKTDIFNYVYGVLHHPAYREKYALNLKREFPRIPFYKDFFQWRDWGAELMDLHINYESQTPFALMENGKRIMENEDSESFVVKPKVKLRADKTQGIIEIDSQTQLTGIPALAWEYKLGNRSAIEWILDQYKERKPKDATIAERFNTYKFADYKEQVIDLIKKVTNVSVKTMEIINSMP